MTNDHQWPPSMTPKRAKKSARIATKSDIQTKHIMFRTKNYAGPENFTHPPDVINVAFRRSAYPIYFMSLSNTIERVLNDFMSVLCLWYLVCPPSWPGSWYRLKLLELPTFPASKNRFDKNTNINSALNYWVIVIISLHCFKAIGWT